MRLRLFISDRFPAFMCVSVLICLLVCDSCHMRLVVSDDAVTITATDERNDDSFLNALLSDRVTSLMPMGHDVAEEADSGFECYSSCEYKIIGRVKAGTFFRNVYYVFVSALAP